MVSLDEGNYIRLKFVKAFNLQLNTFCGVRLILVDTAFSNALIQTVPFQLSDKDSYLPSLSYKVSGRQTTFTNSQTILYFQDH